MDNTIDSSKTILWQYDKAFVFQRLLQGKDDLANMAVSKTWDKFRDAFFDVNSDSWLTDPEITDSDRKFGLWIWGTIIGVARPQRADGSFIGDELYRRLLVARNFLYTSNGSLADLNYYVHLLFDCGNNSSHPSRKVTIVENFDMTIKYKFNWALSEDEALLISLDNDGDGMSDALPHPTGVEQTTAISEELVYFGFDGFYDASGSRLLQRLRRTWYYEIAESGDEVVLRKVASKPFYGVGSDGKVYQYVYDDDGDDYSFVDDEGMEYLATEQANLGNVFDSEDLPVAHELSYIEAGAFVYENSSGQFICEQPYWKDENGGELHALHEDENGWYYTVGSDRIYVRGQSLGTFDNSFFNDAESGEP